MGNEILMHSINFFLEFLSIRKYQLYLDLDGVLCNWEKAVYDIGKGTADQIEKKYSPSELWAIINSQKVKFWSDMEWMPDGRKLWKYCKDLSPTILSAPPGRQPGLNYALKGKRIWVDNNLGKDVKAIFVAAHLKKNHAGKNKILVDDREPNIKGWINNGGIGILHKSADETISELKKYYTEEPV